MQIYVQDPFSDMQEKQCSIYTSHIFFTGDLVVVEN